VDAANAVVVIDAGNYEGGNAEVDIVVEVGKSVGRELYEG